MASDRGIPVAKPWLDDIEAQAAARPILSGWVTQGPEVAAFEKEFGSYVGARYACAVANCTAALHLALLALGVGPGDEVITVSHSFIATANSIRYCGARPVFVDIDPTTYNIDPDKIEAAITERTNAILCVHQVGMPCDMAASLPSPGGTTACRRGRGLCDRQRDPLRRPLGKHWQAARRHRLFLISPTQGITTGDGGMFTTSNEEWDRQFR